MTSARPDAHCKLEAFWKHDSVGREEQRLIFVGETARHSHSPGPCEVRQILHLRVSFSIGFVVIVKRSKFMSNPTSGGFLRPNKTDVVRAGKEG